MRKLSIEEMHRLSLKEYQESSTLPLTLLLDDVRSMHNVGAIFRTADAFRIERIILCGITATPPATLIHKTALGAEDSVPWTYEKDSLSAVETLKESGNQIWVLEQTTGSTPPEHSPLMINESVVLVVGNEVFGVRNEIVDVADRCIEIPQYGTKHSLNVSVSCGIVLYSILQPLLPQLAR